MHCNRLLIVVRCKKMYQSSSKFEKKFNFDSTKKVYFCTLFMSKLRQKSDFNINSAEYLIASAFYAPSVHCSYYSCFQLLKYTIKEFFGIDYDTLATNISNSQYNTHKYVINYVTDELTRFVGIEESRKFKRTINDLKLFREESDYENIEINLDKGEAALRKAKEIRQYLVTNFNV